MSSIRKHIRALASRNEEVYAIEGTVTAISGTTCTVAPGDDTAELLGIQLAGGLTSDILIRPKLNSRVMVVMTSDSEGFLAGWTEVESIELTGKKKVSVKSSGPISVEGKTVDVSATGSVKVKSGSGITLNSGALGGVPIAQSVALQLNRLEADVNALKALVGVLAGIGTNAPTVPILGAMVAPFAAWAAKVVVPTVAKSIENPQVKQ